MRRYLLLILSALLLVSCVREWEPEEVLTDDGLVERTWTVAMNDGTRATLGDDLRPVWEEGEQLSVYDHVAKVGRIFEIISVDGDVATISGEISAGGDTPFDAIYPAKSAGEWSEDGTNTLNLPDVQVIPAGRNVCPDVLVSTAHANLPDGIIPFHNISSLLKVQVSREGIADISIDLVDSSDDVHGYKAATAAGTLAKDTNYYIAVDPGAYAGGVKIICSDGFGQEYQKSSANPLEVSAGGMKNLGTVDGTPRRYYRIMGETKVYAKQDDLLSATGLLDGISSLMINYVVNPFLNNSFPDRNSTSVGAISYTYRSADPQGNPVELSALVYIPKKVLDGEQTLTGIALATHGSIASKAECPTERAQYEGAFAWKNYAVVMPDYYGFGVSADRPQAYLDAETSGRGSIDAYLAALQLMADLDIEKPDRLYSFGYSQGGFNSMANLKYVSTHPDLGITFDKVMCGGSPFDVPVTWNAYLNPSADDNFTGAIGFIPLTVVSINESQKLGLDYSTIFRGSLLDNWRDWILSKDYTLAQINTKLGTTNLADILTDSMMAGTGSSFEAIIATCQRYSLTSGWTVPPSSDTRIIIFHSEKDDIVPFANFTSMKKFLSEDNGLVEGSDYTAIDYVGSSLTAAYTGHFYSAIFFIQNTINEW